MTNEKERIVLATVGVVAGTAIGFALEWQTPDADGIQLWEAISGMAGVLVVVFMLVVIFRKSKDIR